MYAGADPGISPGGTRQPHTIKEVRALAMVAFKNKVDLKAYTPFKDETKWVQWWATSRSRSEAKEWKLCSMPLTCQERQTKHLALSECKVRSMLYYRSRFRCPQPNPSSDSIDTPGTHKIQLWLSSSATEPPPGHLHQHIQYSV
jgi:hypothetical protein